MWGGIIGAGIGAVLIWLWVEWRWRARFMRRVAAHACIGCGQPFEDAIATYVGPIDAAKLARLDAFQKRFAAQLIRCGDCDAVNICTAEGQPFRVVD